MQRSKKAKLFSIVISTVLVGSLLSGCGSSSSSNGTKSTAEQKLTYNLGADPQTIDPGLNDSVEGGTVCANAFEGLLDLDANEKPVAGVAEKWEVSKGGTHYKFHLRKNAKWSDGKPVKASDFEYAWKRALDPKTGSSYAYQLYYIKNAEAYNEDTTGAVSADTVGVKATDDYTLDVDLESPTAYFLSLMAFPTYYPVRKDIVEGHSDWATKPETYVTNGAFTLKDYKLKDSMTFTKNKYYWNASSIKLSTLKYTLLDDETAYFSAFQSGQIDMIESPPTEQTPTLLANKTAKSYPYIGTYYYCFNFDAKASALDPAAAKVMQNTKVRQAMSLAIDRASLVKNVVKGGQTPSTTFVPAGVTVDGKDFKNKKYSNVKLDAAKAKKLLAEAGYPDGKGFPKIELMYNSMQSHKAIAEAIQDMLKKNLNIDLTLRSEDRKVQNDDLTKHKFVMGRTGWIADYNDPMTFLDLFVTGAGNNNPAYSNPEYDKLVEAAKKETNSTKRTEDLHKAEDILMNDMPVIPLYEYNNIICMKKYVKGVNVSPLGFIFFQGSSIEK